MKEKPIIFTGDMVKAILEGRKSMTRRPLKPQPKVHEWQGKKFIAEKCPYGVPGDRLWVRETWALIFNGEDCLHSEDEDPCPCEACHIEYRTDTNSKYPAGWEEDEARSNDDAPKWRPSIHMSRWASRITLEITNVRVERLQEITEEDANLEGVDWYAIENKLCNVGRCQQAFQRLWDSMYTNLNLWSCNPWIWVISFKRI